jgi:phage major head subunit gpT-like protein
MATEARSTFNNFLQDTLFAVAQDKGFKRHPQEWKDWCVTRTSKQAYEESGYMSGFGYLANKPEGADVSYDSRIQGPVKRWVHDTFALGVRITEEAIEDLQKYVMSTAMKDLGTSAAATMHKMATRMLMTGTATTYHTTGAGVALFSASHSLLGGGTWSNLGSAATPTEAALTAAIRNFEQITDHRGKQYAQMAKTVVCGPSLEFTFDKLLGSTYEPDTANNAVNAVIRRRKLKLVVDHEITDDRWVVFGEKDPDVGFIHFDRVRPTMSRHGDPDTGDALFVVRCRFSNECNDPRSAYMIPNA